MNRTLLAIAALGALIACAPAQSNSKNGSASTAVSSADTLVGLVTEVGSDPATWMSIRPNGGGSSLRLSGEAVPLLRSVSRTEVWVSGARQLDEFRVDMFEVRKANDVAVDDGTVSVEGGKVYLTTRSGTKREIPYAPPALAAVAGSRIWVTRPSGMQSPTWGLIKR